MKLLSLTLGLIMLMTGCRREEHGSSRAEPAGDVLAVKTERVVSVTKPVLVPIAGRVRAIQEARLHARVSGSVENVSVGLGDKVVAGQLLAKLAVPELEARVAQVRAALVTARREAGREHALEERGVSTAETAKTLAEQLIAAEAAVVEVEALLAQAEVRAPFAGYITERLVDAGEVVQMGRPLLTLAAEGKNEVVADIPETIALGLRPGTEVASVIGATPFTLKLREIAPRVSGLAHTVEAKFDLSDVAGLRSGQFATLWLSTGEQVGLWLPENAVLRFGQLERVFVVTPERRLDLRLVKTGARAEGRVEIVAGLVAAEHVVLSPSAALRDGGRVSLLP